MRSLVVLALLVALAMQAPVALPAGGRETPGAKGDGNGGSEGREGGETYADAVVIAALPYSDAGGTCDNVNDITPACGYSVAPDVVYRFTPATNLTITVSLCGSTFDTILDVQQVGGVSIGCNDDDCDLQSEVHDLSLVAGQTYYIVVDGYSTLCGDYQLQVAVCCPTDGACCFDDGSCEVLEADDCAQAGGSFQGLGTPCELNPCQVVPVERTSWGRIRDGFR